MSETPLTQMTDQNQEQTRESRFEQAKTGAVAVTGNIEQGPPQTESTPPQEVKQTAADTTAAAERKAEGGSRRPEAETAPPEKE